LLKFRDRLLAGLCALAVVPFYLLLSDLSSRCAKGVVYEVVFGKAQFRAVPVGV
jgi:hypothetical protein